MRLTIFGATGQTGKPLVTQALDAASFMLNEIKESKYIKHTPVIFNHNKR
ncbi:MAG: hypothetical protein ABR927_08370 [Bacteroidales bacterium]|jgi:uncharacterized protein YbjT (DUF2867 family)